MNALSITGYIRRIQKIKLIAFFIVLTAGLFIVAKVENMLICFLLAFVISYLLNPLVNYVERLGVSRTLSITGVFLLTGLILLLATLAILPLVTDQVESLKAELPKYIAGLTSLMQELSAKAQSFTGNLINVKLATEAESLVARWFTTAFGGLPSFISKSLTISLLAPLFAFFILKDGHTFSKAVMRFVPNHLFELVLNLQNQINVQMGQFIRARLLESLIVGLIVWIGLSILGLPYGVFLGIFGGLTNLIPYVGPIIGAIPAYLILAINHSPAVAFVGVTAVYSLAQVVDIVFIIPLLVARIVNLHPVSVIVVITIGAQTMGVLGMIISIPLASIIKLTLNAAYNHLIDFRL